MVFSDAPSFSGQAYTRYHGLLDGDLNPIGRMYLPSAKFKEIGNFINSLKGLGLVISEFHSETEGDYEIYLENGSKIIFDDRRPFDKILVNLESILSEIGIGKGLSTSSSVKLDYVDLRFGNKIFTRQSKVIKHPAFNQHPPSDIACRLGDVLDELMCIIQMLRLYCYCINFYPIG